MENIYSVQPEAFINSDPYLWVKNDIQHTFHLFKQWFYVWSYQTSIISYFIISRNSPVLCDVFPPLNLQLWKTDTPALQVPEAILIQTLEKGTQGLAQRRKEEYRLWENSKFFFTSTTYSFYPSSW